jgi:hypothetical protein
MSNKKRIVTLGLGMVGGALALWVHAATPALNVKLGLWETRAEVKMSGDMSGMISDAQMQNMTPEQKARMQAAMQQAMAEMQKPHYAKSCMTAQKLARGFDVTDERDSSCTSTITTNTGSQYEAHVVCGGGAGRPAHSMTVHVTAESAEHVTGVVKGDQTQGSKGMAYSGTFEGKWLASDCGTVKDYQPEPAPK